MIVCGKRLDIDYTYASSVAYFLLGLSFMAADDVPSTTITFTIPDAPVLPANLSSLMEFDSDVSGKDLNVWLLLTMAVFEPKNLNLSKFFTSPNDSSNTTASVPYTSLLLNGFLQSGALIGLLTLESVLTIATLSYAIHAIAKNIRRRRRKGASYVRLDRRAIDNATVRAKFVIIIVAIAIVQISLAILVFLSLFGATSNMDKVPAALDGFSAGTLWYIDSLFVQIAGTVKLAFEGPLHDARYGMDFTHFSDFMDKVGTAVVANLITVIAESGWHWSNMLDTMKSDFGNVMVTDLKTGNDFNVQVAMLNSIITTLNHDVGFQYVNLGTAKVKDKITGIALDTDVFAPVGSGFIQTGIEPTQPSANSNTKPSFALVPGSFAGNLDSWCRTRTDSSDKSKDVLCGGANQGDSDACITFCETTLGYGYCWPNPYGFGPEPPCEQVSPTNVQGASSGASGSNANAGPPPDPNSPPWQSFAFHQRGYMPPLFTSNMLPQVRLFRKVHVRYS